MRSPLLLCAIALGASCGASAEELGLASFFGLASFYGAAGMTAAHRTLPMGTAVRVVNLDNGRALIVRIADRGPFIRGRVIDVSTAAADSLGFRSAGLAHVRLERVAPETREPAPRPVQVAAAAPPAVSSAAICRYDAGRLERLRGEAGLSADGLGCGKSGFRLFALEPRSDDLALFAPRGGVILAGTAAAASIPVSAMAEAPERETLRLRLLRFAQRSKAFTPHAVRGEAALPGTEAAASIPVNALAEVPERHASPAGAGGGCDAATRCEKQAPGPASNPVLLLFARLRHIFD